MALRVNGKLIPQAAILAEMKRLMEFYGQHMSREELGRHAETLLRRAKEHAIGTQLLIEEVQRRRVEVPEAEVEAALAALTRQAGGEDQLGELLARQGLTREQLRQSIRIGKQLDQLVARITASEPECTEEELRAYYEQHRDRYAAPDQAQVRHVLIKPASASEADRAAARSRLLALKRQVEEGEDFAGLAAAHSECPSGKQTGGSLGWIARGSTLPEFDRVVFEMEVGEISDVIETPLGFHIVEKLDEELGEPLAYEEVRDRIRELLTHERRGRALSRYVNKLRETAVIEDDGEEVDGREVLGDSFLDGAEGS